MEFIEIKLFRIYLCKQFWTFKFTLGKGDFFEKNVLNFLGVYKNTRATFFKCGTPGIFNIKIKTNFSSNLQFSIL